jgi:hypothetical protein
MGEVAEEGVPAEEQVVECRHSIAAAEELPAEKRSNVSRPAGDEDVLLFLRLSINFHCEAPWAVAISQAIEKSGDTYLIQEN